MKITKSYVTNVLSRYDRVEKQCGNANKFFTTVWKLANNYSKTEYYLMVACLASTLEKKNPKLWESATAIMAIERNIYD